MSRAERSTTAAAPESGSAKSTAAQPGWIRRLGGYVLRHRRNVLLAVSAAVLGSACQTVVPLIARQIVDGVIVQRNSALWPWLVLLVVVGLAGFGFAYIRRYRGGQVGLGVQYDLRNAMHDHLQAMDLANLSRMPTGQLVSRANSDSTLVQGLLNFMPLMGGNVLLMLLSLVVMLFLSPLLALVSFVIVPVVIGVSYRMRWKVFPATWDGQQREGDVAQIVDEDVNGVRVVKAFGQEDRELARLAGAAKTLYGSRMRAVRLQSRYQPLLEAIPAIGQVAILALGGWMTLRHDISLGTFLAFSTYVAQFVAPARQLAGVLTIGQQARAGVERIFQLLDLAPAVADEPDAVALPAPRGEVRFTGVRFGYDTGHPVLEGIDLTIAAGERVAVVGPSGSGKSTLAMLISRFYDPDSGTVEVDGHDVRSVTLASLRRAVGMAFEDSFLFSDTVRANIAYGRPDATEDQIEAAARAASAHEFVTALPNGYDTTVGERGLTLSGGQRQRIALARAILADPRILILDDATSAVDAKIEESIHDALRDVLADRTTLLIAHRRSTLHLADRIIVLDEGRIVEDGTHEQLLERSALYRTLLSGLDEQAAERIGDSIEALASISVGTTASAWTGERDTGRPRAASRTIGAPSIGPGLGGSGGGWKLNLAPTPELLARVAALPAVRDHAKVDLPRESRHQRGFSLRGLLSEFRRPLLVGLLLVVIDALAGLAGPALVKTGIDNGVMTGSRAVLFGASALFLVVTLADLIDEIGETFVTGRAAERIMLSLRIRIWAQLQRLSLDYYEREMAGRIMTRMTTDVDQFESLIENGLLAALVSSVTFVGVGVALVIINPELGLCALTVVIPLAIGTVIFRRKAATLYDLARERIAIVNADFQESLSGVREAQAFTHENATRARFHKLGRDYLAARVAAQRLVAVYFPFVQFISAGADAIVLGVGAGLIASGHLTAGALIAFLLYIDMFFSPIQQLSQVFDAWQQTRVSVGRIAELMRLDTLTPTPEHPQEPGALHGELALTGVRFAYPSAIKARPERRGPKDSRLPTLTAGGSRPPEALRGIELRIRAGETVAMVGQTGAGKSTVMKLLARFYDPDSGGVSIDGHDLRTLDLRGFRRRLGYVPQEGFLFTGSIRDNIAYGRPDAQDADVEAAARAVGAHEFVAALPGGYLHELTERGRSLSAGQRQLIALARAELVDPAVLLLDEATSNLDMVTEARVTEAMQRVARDRTTVVIAHRLQTAKTADRIVVLDAGRVAEIGSHDELLDAGGLYASMWQAFELVGEGPTARSGRP
ncbi:MAG TPA: ABC transporter ATP-binding protein [Pseudonocardiaceae bacterium]|jgi:ATP-binding cassette subfamily B protein|nr:ABC transporter ATP-binding protein [Pseudonocardiaceae bacterium]